MTGMFDLTGQVAVVTGGSRGIGFAMAAGLAQCGSDVVIWDIDPDRNDEAAARLAEHGTRVGAMTVDVSDEDAVVVAMAAVAEDMGRIDTAIANAGVSGGPATMLDLDGAELRRVLAVNLDGMFFTLREAARAMQQRAKAGEPGGSLIGQSSLQAMHGNPAREHYGASKGATISVIKGMAVEFGRWGIRANAIMPGFIATDMNVAGQQDKVLNEKVVGRLPIRRWGTPDDIAGLAVYLASDAARYQSGTAIEIDGGYSAL
ncbi:MAG: SDR family NAD(P)-dependent oxidoreductase [Acidimicrobiales bacterium]